MHIAPAMEDRVLLLSVGLEKMEAVEAGAGNVAPNLTGLFAISPIPGVCMCHTSGTLTSMRKSGM